MPRPAPEPSPIQQVADDLRAIRDLLTGKGEQPEPPEHDDDTPRRVDVTGD